MIIIICQWIHKWKKRGCITEENYKRSKLLFQKYLNSSHITSHMLIYDIHSTEDWVHENFIPNNNYYAFFIRRLIINTNQNINSVLKGENYGVKKDSNGDMPNHSLKSAT